MMLDSPQLVHYNELQLLKQSFIYCNNIMANYARKKAHANKSNGGANSNDFALLHKIRR
jgi:hypothetical protein